MMLDHELRSTKHEFVLSDVERFLTILYISFLLVELHDFGVRWALINVFQELFDSIRRALSLALDLVA